MKVIPINRILLESDAEETDKIDDILEEMAKAIVLEGQILGKSEISCVEHVISITAENANTFYQSSF